MDKLWTPPDQRVAPTVPKKDGGSYFDDELPTKKAHNEMLLKEGARLINHLNQRPDHDVLVSSGEERTKMREVFNWWRREGVINHNPNIRIDYGIPDGQIRIGDGR